MGIGERTTNGQGFAPCMGEFPVILSYQAFLRDATQFYSGLLSGSSLSFRAVRMRSLY